MGEERMDREELFGLQDDVLISLSKSLEPLDREALYTLPPWRAALLARVAYQCRRISRVERDAIVREAALVGGKGRLKPWKDRTPSERALGVRAPKKPESGVLPEAMMAPFDD